MRYLLHAPGGIVKKWWKTIFSQPIFGLRVRYILLPLIFVLSNGLGAISLMGHGQTTYAAQQKQASISASYADTVIVMDNINKIKTHDPEGVRFSAAQIFVDQSQQGDRIGVVKIPSSNTSSSVELRGLTTIQDSNSRTMVKQALTQSSFGPVDPGPTAYFVPALQKAGQMLLASQDNNHKYVLIVTDSVAQSGDPKYCSSASDPYHNWFCEIHQLEAQGISVILLGFSTPGSEAEIQPTQQYIEAQGGIVLQVEDGAGLAMVAQNFTDILAQTHPNVFYAKLDSVSGTLSIDPQAQLDRLTFVALGENGTTPHLKVDGQNSAGGTLYNASTSNYWLETISNTDLAGTWHLSTDDTSLQVLIIGVSAANFRLVNPAPSDSNNAGANDISVRYVPANTPVVLRAQITELGDEALTTVPFTADPLGQKQPFSSETLPLSSIPGSQATDVSAIFEASSASGESLSIGLGKPVSQGVYLTKQFQIKTTPDLTSNAVKVNVTPPASSLPGAAAFAQAQGSASNTAQSLAIFERDTDSPSGWALVGTSNAGAMNAQGSFSVTHSCGDTYTVVALEEISGSLKSGQYDYIAEVEYDYIPHLQQTINGNAVLASGRYLAPWPLSNQVTLNITFTSTFCTPQNLALNILTPSNGSSLELDQGGGTFTVAGNGEISHTLTAPISGCSPLSMTNQTIQLKLTLAGNNQLGAALSKQGWQPSVECPSTLTYIMAYPLQSLVVLLVLGFLVVRGSSRVIESRMKPRLAGAVEITRNSPDLAEDDIYSEPAYEPVHVRIPGARHAGVWYLARSIDTGGTIYSFVRQETSQALLRFEAFSSENGCYLMLSRTGYAIGRDLPCFYLTQIPVGLDPAIYDGEPIVIDQDVIYPEMNVDYSF